MMDSMLKLDTCKILYSSIHLFMFFISVNFYFSIAFGYGKVY